MSIMYLRYRYRCLIIICLFGLITFNTKKPRNDGHLGIQNGEQAKLVHLDSRNILESLVSQTCVLPCTFQLALLLIPIGWAHFLLNWAKLWRPSLNSRWRANQTSCNLGNSISGILSITNMGIVTIFYLL